MGSLADLRVSLLSCVSVVCALTYLLTYLPSVLLVVRDCWYDVTTWRNNWHSARHNHDVTRTSFQSSHVPRPGVTVTSPPSSSAAAVDSSTWVADNARSTWYRVQEAYKFCHVVTWHDYVIHYWQQDVLAIFDSNWCLASSHWQPAWRHRP